ncbi:hypothetical protein CEUSTIGMA_g12975.t1 [Chlamydomonas eustigma]|uniref:Uncharacterized protein n=1 Tax=Chlamydomonas eustigma TaxID=1157962 RepID=A0A250XRY9_9CHLO|nr:hypothetical protein CEUSTIGMA_g12975.t1 [Chlamydomonas eustigma]|eukprot:GAX85560.1 hypothetical protein CEUSTIGMA_g12975.t1 [Chlamydomonas eustigma]
MHNQGLKNRRYLAAAPLQAADGYMQVKSGEQADFCVLGIPAMQDMMREDCLLSEASGVVVRQLKQGLDTFSSNWCCYVPENLFEVVAASSPKKNKQQGRV